MGRVSVSLPEGFHRTVCGRVCVCMYLSVCVCVHTRAHIEIGIMFKVAFIIVTKFTFISS